MASRFYISLTAFSLVSGIAVAIPPLPPRIPQQNQEIIQEHVQQLIEDIQVNETEVQQQKPDDKKKKNQKKDDKEEVSYVDEDEYEEDDDLVVEEVEAKRRVAFPQKKNPEVSPPKGKQKAHFAGTRRPQPTIASTEAPKKRRSAVKNKWVKSKTHPKVDKKRDVLEIADAPPAQLSSDRPYYKRSNMLEQTPLILADDEEMDREPVYEENDALTEGELYPKGGFLAPRGHIFFTGEWLYWRVRQEGMEYAPSKKLHFNFKSGYRVGLGVHLPQDKWDMYVNYTRYFPTHAAKASGLFYPLFLFGATTATEAHAHWSIEFQTLDVVIGRPFYLSDTLVLHPFFGIKGAWIHQHAHVRYQGGAIPAGQTYRTYFKNDFKGAGPLFGIDSNWRLGAGFSLFGDFAAAIPIGQFHNKQVQHQFDGTVPIDMTIHNNLASPNVQLISGLAWDWNFCKRMCHLGFSAGFEAQYWWDQNQTEQFTDTSQPIYVRQQGSLALYGLTFKGRLDF